MNPQDLQSSMALGLSPHLHTSHWLSRAVATLVKGPSEVVVMTERRSHPSRTNPCTHSCLWRIQNLSIQNQTGTVFDQIHIPCRALSHNDRDRKKDTHPEVWDIMVDATGLLMICESCSKSSMCNWLSKEGSIMVTEDRDGM